MLRVIRNVVAGTTVIIPGPDQVCIIAEITKLQCRRVAVVEYCCCCCYCCRRHCRRRFYCHCCCCCYCYCCCCCCYCCCCCCYCYHWAQWLNRQQKKNNTQACNPMSLSCCTTKPWRSAASRMVEPQHVLRRR